MSMKCYLRLHCEIRFIRQPDSLPEYTAHCCVYFKGKLVCKMGRITRSETTELCRPNAQYSLKSSGHPLLPPAYAVELMFSSCLFVCLSVCLSVCIGGSRGGRARRAPPPTGPDSFVLTCKIFET